MVLDTFSIRCSYSDKHLCFHSFSKREFLGQSTFVRTVKTKLAVTFSMVMLEIVYDPLYNAL